jgi:hypothetical protein
MAKQIISESRLREIISEEAARFKKKLTLEAEKKKLLKRLNEMYTEEAMEEVVMEEETLNELFEFRKARNDFYATHKADIEALKKAYKAGDMAYVELATKIQDAVQAEYMALAKKYGISGGNDLAVLKKDLLDTYVPMDIETFKRQKESGTSVLDVVTGASAGRSKIVGQK